MGNRAAGASSMRPNITELNIWAIGRRVRVECGRTECQATFKQSVVVCEWNAAQLNANQHVLILTSGASGVRLN